MSGYIRDEGLRVLRTESGGMTMSNFFLQLGAESVTVLMYIATITVAVFAGMALRKMKDKKAAK